MMEEKSGGNRKALAITAILVTIFIAAINSIGYVGNAISDVAHSKMWLQIAGIVAILSGITAIIEGKEEAS